MVIHIFFTLRIGLAVDDGVFRLYNEGVWGFKNSEEKKE